jgi:hypothetical protein
MPLSARAGGILRAEQWNLRRYRSAPVHFHSLIWRETVGFPNTMTMLTQWGVIVVMLHCASPVRKGSMYSYEIRTFGRLSHSSLIMFAQCPDDLTAILVAREATRKGQAIEVWRGEILVYRVAPRLDRIQKRTAAKGRRTASQYWAGWLLRARS